MFTHVNFNKYKMFVHDISLLLALDSDDVLLLDAITRKDDYSRPNFTSGSNSKFPDVEDYPRQGETKLHVWFLLAGLPRGGATCPGPPT